MHRGEGAWGFLEGEHLDDTLDREVVHRPQSTLISLEPERGTQCNTFSLQEKYQAVWDSKE
jgi:hypothetical protein